MVCDQHGLSVTGPRRSEAALLCASLDTQAVFLRWTGSGSKLNYRICLLSSAWFLGASWAGRRFSHSNIILCVREMFTGYSLS